MPSNANEATHNNRPFERCNNYDDNGYLSCTPPEIVSIRRFIVVFSSHDTHHARTFFQCQHVVYFATGVLSPRLLSNRCLFDFQIVSQLCVCFRFFLLIVSLFCLSDVLLTSLLVRSHFWLLEHQSMDIKEMIKMQYIHKGWSSFVGVSMEFSKRSHI